MIEKKYGELIELDQMVGSMYQKDPNLRNTKFGYGYDKFYKKNLKELVQQYKIQLTDIWIDLAAIDEKTKTVITSNNSPRGFEFSKEDLKSVIRAELKLDNEWRDKVVQVEPYFIKPEHLIAFNEDQKELMKGLLIE